MTARKCFTGKIMTGKVSARAGEQILDMLDQFEREHTARLGAGGGLRQAALEAAAAAQAQAARKADLARRAAIAQANVLRAVAVYDDIIGGLRREGREPLSLAVAGRRAGAPVSTVFSAVRSLLMRDPHEIAEWLNVDMLARDVRGRAHATFAEAIEFLRPKALGFKAETAREHEVLEALYGGEAGPQAQAVAKAWSQVAEDLWKQHRDAGGAIPHRDLWRLPNPTFDAAKVRAIGPDRFKAFVRDRLDRVDMLDFETNLPLRDERFAQLLDEVTDGILKGPAETLPTGNRGRRMLANARDFSRFFVWKDATAWREVAEAFGTHASVYETMIGHISGMAEDIALMRILGPNPEATKAFILDLFDREAAALAVEAAPDGPVKRAVRTNEKVAARLRADRQRFENAWAEATGLNDVPVSSEMARNLSDMRSALVAAQMGSAIISSITDIGTTAITARFTGLPAMRVISRAVRQMAEPGSEIFAAQTGLVADSLASAVGTLDRAMGETIRTGRIAKLGSATIRASGLRRWTAALRNAFGLEMQAHVAREASKAWTALDADFRATLGRYGIGETDWRIIGAAAASEPRPGARFMRPIDVAREGSAAARTASEKLARLINTEMDYAVIERDPVARSLLIGDTRPGTAKGEFWRAAGMYKMFPTSFVMLHFARAFARGFDGRRMAHGALTFAAMTALGALAMQAKQVVAGRDPYTLDPTDTNGIRAWGAAILQGGGLGVFGDMLFVDKTRYNNTWAAIVAGPQFGAIEAVLGDFLLKNLRLAAQGKETHFLGDALYVAGRYAPGSSLWYGRLAFRRAILDQLALMIDDRAPERFRRIERETRRDWGQDYWWRQGEALPARAPAIGAGP